LILAIRVQLNKAGNLLSSPSATQGVVLDSKAVQWFFLYVRHLWSAKLVVTACGGGDKDDGFKPRADLLPKLDLVHAESTEKPQRR
jgi:hypothetical protein